MNTSRIAWLSLSIMGCLLVTRALAELSADDKHALANLRAIGQGCLMYANDNRGFLPGSFGLLASTYLKDPAAFLDPRLKSTVPADWDKMTPVEQQAWVDKNCDFELTNVAGQRVQKIKDAHLVPLAQSREREGVQKAIVFTDGHAEIAPPKPPPTTRE